MTDEDVLPGKADWEGLEEGREQEPSMGYPQGRPNVSLKRGSLARWAE